MLFWYGFSGPADLQAQGGKPAEGDAKNNPTAIQRHSQAQHWARPRQKQTPSVSAPLLVGRGWDRLGHASARVCPVCACLFVSGSVSLCLAN